MLIETPRTIQDDRIRSFYNVYSVSHFLTAWWSAYPSKFFALLWDFCHLPPGGLSQMLAVRYSEGKVHSIQRGVPWGQDHYLPNCMGICDFIGERMHWCIQGDSTREWGYSSLLQWRSVQGTGTPTFSSWMLSTGFYLELECTGQGKPVHRPTSHQFLLSSASTVLPGAWVRCVQLFAR